MRNRRSYLLALISLVLTGAGIFITWHFLFQRSEAFDGERAYNDVLFQVSLGPRIPKSEAHDRVIDWMQEELKKAGWEVEIQETEMDGQPIRNVIARRSDSPPQIILGAHYDSRLIADQDKGAGGSEPVPGANDGASGVAILLELARSLPSDTVPLWLVFFDAEDNGNLPGWEWIMGSRAFVASLDIHPKAAVIVDMVGDANLNIYIEGQSDKALVAEIWAQAAELGYSKQFIAQSGRSITDDHVPFIEAGIPAVDIIDFDYPYWHTSEDTPDKVSAESLLIVGETLWHWIVGFQ